MYSNHRSILCPGSQNFDRQRGRQLDLYVRDKDGKNISMGGAGLFLW